MFKEYVQFSLFPLIISTMVVTATTVTMAILLFTGRFDHVNLVVRVLAFVFYVTIIHIIVVFSYYFPNKLFFSVMFREQKH